MHLNDLPRILLRLWWLVVAVTVVVAGATLWVASASQSYAARTDVTVVGTNVADDLSAERGKPPLFDAVHGAREFIVEEVGEPRHAEAGGVETFEIFRLSFKVLKAFDRQHRADGPGGSGGGSQQGVE